MEGGNDILRNYPAGGIKRNLAGMIEMIRLTGAQVVLIGVTEKNIFGDVEPLYDELAEEHEVLYLRTVLNDLLRESDRPEDSAFRNANLYSGGGGLLGTIDDYMKFARLLHGKSDILSPTTLNFMKQNHLAGDIADMGPQSFAEQPMQGMGFGIGGATVLDPARARCVGNVGDFSWGGMASTFFWIDPVLDMSVVFFTQLAPSSSYPARPQLKGLIHGALA
jgi:CubicO group peptidase (beta-lactamase class C family)